MADPKEGHEAQVHNMRRSLYTQEGEERLKLWMEYSVLQGEGDDPAKHEWMTSSLPYLKLHSWSTADSKHPRVVFSYTVPSINANRMGNMHGGCTATLFDFCTTMPLTLVNRPGFWFWLGVSRTLNVTYLKPIPVGERILIECEIMSIGKTLCTIRGVMRRESDGVALATCEHGKYNTDPEAQETKEEEKKKKKKKAATTTTTTTSKL